MAASARNQSLELVDLPAEVLVEIFEHVPDEDLLTARLVCKEFCNAATPRFAKVNFTGRIHDVSPYSINTLVDITEHPVFGRYVKTVAICAARRLMLPEVPIVLPLPLLTRQIGTHISMPTSHSGFVVINIFDNRGVGILDRRVIFGSNRLTKCHGFKELTDSHMIPIAYQMVKTLEHTIYAARRARCPVECLKIMSRGYHAHSTKDEFDSAMHRILESNLTPLSIYLDSRMSRRLSYDNKTQCLELRCIDFDDFSRNGVTILPLQASYTWLLAQTVTQLKIAQIEDCKIDRLQPLFTPHLRYFELSMVSIWTNHFNQGFWSEGIGMMSELSGLQHCKLSCLTYSLETSWADHVDIFNEERYLDLPGHGQVPCQENTFHLRFRDGLSSVKMSGDDVCEQLRGLACYVAAAEAQKVQNIVSAGCVDNFVVGIIDEVED